MKPIREVFSFGLVYVLAGVITFVEMRLQPERLHGPMWVGDCIAAAFIIGGFVIFLKEKGYQKTGIYRWGVVGIMLLMLVAPAWIAFGPGPRDSCRVALIGRIGVEAISSEILCRIGFGFGAVIGAVALVLATRHALNLGKSES